MSFFKRRIPQHCALTAVLFGATAGLAGCGGNAFEVASAGGKVVCGGKPVTTGTVILTPIASGTEPGRPAIAGVQSDGTFLLSTYEEQDGAIVGKHRVTYAPPEGTGDEEDEEQAVVEEGGVEKRTQPAAASSLTENSCVLAEEMTVEVTAEGPNEFTLELVPASPGQEQEQ